MSSKKFERLTGEADSQNVKEKKDDEPLDNPTDLWKARKGLPLWLWLILVIVILIFVPIIVALITTGLPIIYRQENSNKAENTNPINTNSVNSNAVNANAVNASTNTDLANTFAREQWVVKLERDIGLPAAEQNKERFQDYFQNLNIFVRESDGIKSSGKAANKTYFYIAAVYNTKAEAKAAETLAHSKWKELGYESEYKNSAEAIKLGEWCPKLTKDTNADYHVCSR